MGKYIDNKLFFEKVVEHVNKCKEKEAAGEEHPIIPDFIGKCFIDIATNLASRRNFVGYKYKEDMISDALFDMTRYVSKFNSEKTNNAFSYFTQIAFFAFLRRIAKEKKHLYTKYKAINNSEIFGTLSTSLSEEDNMLIDDIGYSEGARENMNSFVQDYEDKMKKDKEKIKEDKEDKEELE